MKFSEMTYTRPDMPAVFREVESMTARLKEAQSAQEQFSIYKELEQLTSLPTESTIMIW